MFTFTDMAIDYSVDELDDLTDRKVAPEGIDGDRLARIIRARRGTARATLSEDHYANVTDSASFGLWGDVTHTGGNRRMVADGRGSRGRFSTKH